MPGAVMRRGYLDSEAWNKTLKYAPVFPEQFSSLQAARQFMSEFVDDCNHVIGTEGLAFIRLLT